MNRRGSTVDEGLEKFAGAMRSGFQDFAKLVVGGDKAPLTHAQYARLSDSIQRLDPDDFSGILEILDRYSAPYFPPSAPVAMLKELPLECARELLACLEHGMVGKTKPGDHAAQRAVASVDGDGNNDGDDDNNGAGGGDGPSTAAGAGASSSSASGSTADSARKAIAARSAFGAAQQPLPLKSLLFGAPKSLPKDGGDLTASRQEVCVCACVRACVRALCVYDVVFPINIDVLSVLYGLVGWRKRSCMWFIVFGIWHTSWDAFIYWYVLFCLGGGVFWFVFGRFTCTCAS